MRAAVIVLPGSNCDHDCYHVLKHVLEIPTRFVWHKETEVPDVDLVVLPGGFSYGDYLRAGAIARFAPVMDAVVRHAERGGLVLGICNGFQILTELGLLPGALVRNRSLKFICRDVPLRMETTNTALTRRLGEHRSLVMPIAHGEGCYTTDASGLADLEAQDQILFRYEEEDGSVADVASVNGSVGAIAGLCNAGRNVFGMMPHPERCSEAEVGGPANGGNTDGLLLFQGLMDQVGGAA